MNDLARQGSAAFNQGLHAELAAITADVVAAVGPSMEALVLGGGYGRGEGGVVLIDGVEHPYNDFDLFLFVKPGAHVQVQALNARLEPHAHRLGIHVDVSRPIRLAEIPNWPPALIWLDLLEGHTVLAGPTDVLSSRAPAWLGRPLPSVEALRLLLNRGAGLLWAMRVVRNAEPPPDPQFVRRNAYKAALALGDALLILHGGYRSVCTGRDALFQALADTNPEVRALDVADFHREGLAFKFHPDQAPRDAWTTPDLEALCAAFIRVFLAIESRRHGIRLDTPAAYAAWDGRREPREGGLERLLRNAVQNLRAGHVCLRAPRERLYPDLPRLLAPTSSHSGTWPDETARWLTAWRRTL
jgi:hypothetical protein